MSEMMNHLREGHVAVHFWRDDEGWRWGTDSFQSGPYPTYAAVLQSYLQSRPRG